MDLGTVDVTWVHQGPAHEELVIILCVVQFVTGLFVLIMKLPNFCTILDVLTSTYSLVRFKIFLI